MPSKSGNVPVTAIGFGTPDPTRPLSPALQRQMSLLTADKDADYFLFDELDRPIRFMLHDMWTKMMFRILRSGVLSGADREGLEAMAEYLIKAMGQKPGLSRRRILEQLEREYGNGVASKVEEFERKAQVNGYPAGTTFLETMVKNFHSHGAKLMGSGLP
jgi:hypothetical protein